jgi:hypothetical protein
MDNFYYPFGSFQEVYVLLYLSQKLDLEIEIDNIAKIFNKNFQKRYPSDIIKLGNLLLMLNMFKLKFIYFCLKDSKNFIIL